MSYDQGMANAPCAAEPFQDGRNCANEVAYARIDESHGRSNASLRCPKQLSKAHDVLRGAPSPTMRGQ